MSLWTELKRRKLFQVGAAYAVIGWVLIQVAALVLPQLQLPDWTVTFVTVLVIFCFPIALFLAWAYELTPDGIRRDSGVQAEGGAQRQASVMGYGITALAAAAAGAGAFWFIGSDSEAEWLDSVLPEVESYLNVADFDAAYRLLREAQDRYPDSTELDRLWSRASWNITIPSEPPGAQVYWRAFAEDGDWQYLGVTPLENIRFPLGLSEIRLELEGYRTVHRTLGGGHLNNEELAGGAIFADGLIVGPEIYRLDPEDAIAANKVRVSGWSLATAGQDLALQDYFLGKYEVTNAEFKAFVDGGGYQRSSLWEPIVVEGEVVPLDEAIGRGWFNDRTGQVGPATWSAGDYPVGADDMPVTGVSWYEAAAYARFVGEDLPSAHHWQQALATSTFNWLLPVSNFSEGGPHPVTEGRALSYSGVFDMAGNVREWTASSIGDEKIILGGSWNDPYYAAGLADASAPPLDRSEGNGFRLAVISDPPEVRQAVLAPFGVRETEAATDDREPVEDAIYAAYSRLFDYDRTALNATVDEVDETRIWRREKISFDAAYGNDRAVLYLYLPTNEIEPYQTVVYWPGWDTFRLNDVDHYFGRQLDFIVKTGRAVAFPVFPGTFERRVGNVTQRAPFDTIAWRDNTIESVKDIHRTIDYLETRRDIDSSAIAYFGYSWGGVNAPVALAQEDRFKAAVIDIGLMPAMPSVPEVDPINSLPRIGVPSLMFSGEFDGMVSVTDAERYFDLIGVAEDRKRHVIALGGHYIPKDLLIRETVEWLDRYLGPTGNW